MNPVAGDFVRKRGYQKSMRSMGVMYASDILRLMRAAIFKNVQWTANGTNGRLVNVLRHVEKEYRLIQGRSLKKNSLGESHARVRQPDKKTATLANAQLTVNGMLGNLVNVRKHVAVIYELILDQRKLKKQMEAHA